MGSLRECFFVSQVKRIKNAELFSPKQGDIIVGIIDKHFQFEIGGKNKDKHLYDDNIYIVKDNIVVSDTKRVIPLRLFGLVR
jgi:hypothetical protein